MKRSHPSNLSAAAALFLALLAACLLAASCATTSPVSLSLGKLPQEQARAELAPALLANLRDFGNNIAAAMLKDYQFKELKETSAGAYLYRYDALNASVPKYAYIVLRLEGSPAITTNAGEKNYILLDSGSIGLVPADEPAAISGAKFVLKFTASGYKEAFNPWVIGEKGSYPEQLLLWFKNPATKDKDMLSMASLLTSAFPRLKYKAP
jgi:hypothetical protein